MCFPTWETHIPSDMCSPVAICLPMEQLGVLEISLKFVCVLDRIGIIFKGLVFKESGKIGVPQEKPLGAHVVLTPGFEPKVGGLSPLCHPCSQKNV